MQNIERTVVTQAGPFFQQAEAFCEDLFLRKAPPLPEKAKDVLVAATPFLAILALIVTAFGVVISPLLALLGVLGAFLSVLTLSGSGVASSLIGIVSSLMSLALGLVILYYLTTSLTGLFNRRLEGWDKLFHANVLDVVYTALSLGFGILGALFSDRGFGTVFSIGASLLSGAFSAVLLALIFYFTFQIREKYL